MYTLGSPEKASSEELARSAKIFEVEEINVADRRGVVIASNVKANIGFDFAASEKTAEFAALTNGVGYCCPNSPTASPRRLTRRGLSMARAGWRSS